MLNAKGIAAAVAATSVSGVSFKDITLFADADYSRDVPAFIPNPESWLNGSTSTLQTFGTANSRFWLVERTFSYLYLQEQVGAVRFLSDIYADMADKMDAVWEALLELNISDVDIVNIVWSNPVTVSDPSGNQFYGMVCDITVKEEVNA